MPLLEVIEEESIALLQQMSPEQRARVFHRFNLATLTADNT